MPDIELQQMCFIGQSGSGLPSDFIWQHEDGQYLLWEDGDLALWEDAPAF